MRTFLLLCFLVLNCLGTNYKVISALPAGNGVDTVARIILDDIKEDNNFIFINKPGAGQSLALSEFNKTGDLILLTSTAIMKNPHALDGLTPVVLFQQQFAFVSRQDFSGPIKTLATGDEYSFSHYIAKSIPDTTIIPYKAASEAIPDILSGRVDAGVIALAAIANNPNLKILSLSYEKDWFALFAHDSDKATTINRQIGNHMDQLTAKVSNFKIEIRAMTPDQIITYINEQSKNYH